MVRNRKGSALVMVMIYSLVLSILGTAILGVAISEYRMEIAHRNGVKAYYLAEAGMEKAIFQITEMDAISPETLVNETWEMEGYDLSLVEDDGQGEYAVTVKSVELDDVILIGEGEDVEVYKKIYYIALKSLAAYKGAPAGVEANILVEDYEETGTENKVEVYFWRQIRGVEDED